MRPRCSTLQGTKYILLKERGGVECLNQTGTTALQKILCPTYQSCGTYCQQDCMSYSCSSTYTAITRRTYASSATLSLSL